MEHFIMMTIFKLLSSVPSPSIQYMYTLFLIITEQAMKKKNI